MNIILGIESSCDETAAAVLDNGKILSSVVASQTDVHRLFKGVVPELASRAHLEKIDAIVEEAILKSGLSSNKLDGIAVTNRPGLLGALLVGVCFAKSLAYRLNIPFIGVNHIEGHLFSGFLSDNKPEYPFIGLVVSGGHSLLFNVRSESQFECIGQTRDDAAGEAFDKVAALLGLDYPGGIHIERIAKNGDENGIKFPDALQKEETFDFSFSGLKTSVLNYIRTHSPLSDASKATVAASFQKTVVHQLVKRTLMAAKSLKCKTISVSGGVACNQRLRDAFELYTSDYTIQFAPKVLCTDNAAMIAYRGWQLLNSGNKDDVTLNAYAR